VTLLDRGSVRFAGTVPELTAVAMTRRYLLRLAHRGGGDVDAASAIERARAAVADRGVVTRADDGTASDVVLVLEEDAVLSDAITAIAAAGLDVVACREERSVVEEAFLRLTGGGVA
jgi:hypothetical protein